MSLLLLLALTACSKNSADTGAPIDQDGDGWTVDEDCNDQAPHINPGMEETCDGRDEDCDGEIDNGVLLTFYADTDLDGFGDAQAPLQACERPLGASENDLDCDDTSAHYNPNAREDDCTDPEDYNCDGSVGYADADGDGFAACEDCDDTNEDLNPDTVWYADSDRDGFGGTLTSQSCLQPDGWLATSDDCDDVDALSHPGADELCDDADNDCDGSVDEDVVDDATFYADADDDGYGDPAVTERGCAPSEGYVDNAEDCDDSTADLSPDTIWYADFDGDGYGGTDWTTASCTQPASHVADSSDCDDFAAHSHPGADELCDDADNDCDSATDEDAVDETTWYTDGDSDGFGDPSSSTLACDAPTGMVADATDCDDSDASLNPDTVWYADLDSDGYGGLLTTSSCTQPTGYVSDNTDCLDLDPNSYPGADETCDSADNDCDSTTDEDPIDPDTWYLDADSDSYGLASSTTTACDQPTGYAALDGDCDDGDSTISPGGAEVLCDGTDQDCDGSDDGLCVPSIYSTIQGALDVATDGDTVHVAAGTYAENLSVTEVDNLTIVGAGAGTTIVEGYRWYSSVLSASTMADLLVQDITFSGGNYAYQGGGAYLYDVTGTFDGVDLTDNACSGCAGGGLYVSSSDLTLTDVNIDDNVSSGSGIYGLGLYCYDSVLAADAVSISGNSSTSYWGSDEGVGFYLNDCTATFVDVVVDDNSATPSGSSVDVIGVGGYTTGSGGLDWTGGSADGNVATTSGTVQGGALHLDADTTLSNVSVSGNDVEASWCGGYGLYGAGDFTGENLIVAGNQCTANATTAYGVSGIGAVVTLTASTIDLSNSSVVDNEVLFNLDPITTSLTVRGLGLYVYGSTSTTVNNVDVSGNTGSVSTSVTETWKGSGLYTSSAAAVTYTNLYGNTGSTPYADETSTTWLSGTSGNLSVDPGYTDTSATDPWDWDLTLTSTSSLLDAGDPSLTDTDGTTSDIGSHGGPDSTW